MEGGSWSWWVIVNRWDMSGWQLSMVEVWAGGNLEGWNKPGGNLHRW